VDFAGGSGEGFSSSSRSLWVVVGVFGGCWVLGEDLFWDPAEDSHCGLFGVPGGPDGEVGEWEFFGDGFCEEDPVLVEEGLQHGLVFHFQLPPVGEEDVPAGKTGACEDLFALPGVGDSFFLEEAVDGELAQGPIGHRTFRALALLGPEGGVAEPGREVGLALGGGGGVSLGDIVAGEVDPDQVMGGDHSLFKREDTE